MSISATVAAADMITANAELDALGHGPANFSVPLRAGIADATHVGLHAWDDADFLSAMQSLSVAVTIRNEQGAEVSFGNHVQTVGLEWSDPTNWHENPVMSGHLRQHDRKTWESLVDYNVWLPGVSGWREIVDEGYPAWVQPTGAHDAYKRGERVSYKGRNWENTGHAANVWAPGVFGWEVV